MRIQLFEMKLGMKLLFCLVVPSMALTTIASTKSQLAQLASMTTLSIDSGDLNVIRDFADSGYITDATTNPLFVSQAGLSGDPMYGNMVDDAVNYAVSYRQPDVDSTIALAIDRLAVNLGKAISELVPGYISTEVDPRLSFDVEATVERGRRVISMYEQVGVDKSRILIKVAATWEGIQAAEILEKEGIRCNLTLVFSVVQAVACAQHGAHLISPFPGRILDWNNAQLRRLGGVASPNEDEGVIACREMYNYFKCHSHDTICMPASWRPSRGTGHELDEIQALAGTDRMTIPAPLLNKLAKCQDPLERQLVPSSAGDIPWMGKGGKRMEEKEFRYRLNLDGCGTDKLGEGLRAFIVETEKLEQVLKVKLGTGSAAI
ncbi:hypothetical protein MPSEU_000488200 [Mayamaea pseudoterrestris]|nr:hypothetical protein MPSEU_000488200 [Mayamaea pseudoterrestris]